MASPATAKNVFTSAGERRWLPIALTVFFALLMGVMVAEGQWLLVAALAVVPLVFLWPVQVALGAFALLIPFDSATFSQGDGNTGTTLNFVVGAAAASILIVTALAGNQTAKATPSRPLVDAAHHLVCPHLLCGRLTREPPCSACPAPGLV